MSLRYKGGVISATPPTTTGGESGTAPGVWTLEQQMQAQAASLWPTPIPPFGAAMRSLRFNSADTTYLSRAITSTSDRRKFTFSCWTKIGYIGSNQKVLLASTDDFSETSWIWFNTVSGRGTTSCLSFETQSPTATVTTDAVFRDPSAWYHIVVAVDTTQATDSNRVKIYVNNVQQTLTGTYPAQNKDTVFNTNGYTHGVGAYWTGTLGPYDGYMTEVVFVDGQQLTPSSFGQTNSTTGVWEPKVITGLTYGTNGFYLKFQDNSGTTSTTLGKDSSGNSNNYTPNNFSVTAGTGNDSLVDTPTPYGTDTGVGGEVRGNYCTINPLDKNPGAAVALSNGNLYYVVSDTGAHGCRRSTMSVSSGKWYAECTISTAVGGGGTDRIGIISATQSDFSNNGNPFVGGFSQGYAYRSDGKKENNNSAATYGSSYTTNDVIGIALDMDAGTVTFYLNGVSQGQAYSGLTGSFTFAGSPYYGGAHFWNFGQRAFAYTAPSNHKAVVNQNLSTPTIIQPDDYFNTVLYTGTGATRSITGVGFAPDFVWNKGRDNAVDHCLNDIVRGANKQLVSNTTGAELTYTNQLTSFDSDGFSLGADNLGYTNYNNVTYVAWNWKGGGAGVSNTAGTISSTVSANTTSGCSIVTYTGTGSSGTVGHGLGVAPSMIIVKNRSVTTFWAVYHASLGNTKAFFLNAVDASVTSSGYWNNTSPTSTVFTVNTENRTNGSTNNMVAYCFAPVAGYSAFGSYDGNGIDPWPGAFIYTGFRPAWVLIKGDNAANAYYSWGLLDIDRNTNNQGYNNALWANRNAVEGKRGNGTDTPGTGDFQLSFTANGFCVSGSGAELDASNATYYWAAFAENPFKYALAR